MAERCATCHRPICPPDRPWRDADCPASCRRSGATPGVSLLDAHGCLRLGVDLRDAQQVKTKTLLARVLQQLNDGVALIDQGEDLPRYQTPEMTISRIEAQDRRNAELTLKLALLGEPVDDGADRLLVVVKEGVYGGSPTVGHTRLPLAQIIGMVRNGETLEGLRRCWGGYPDEFWRVCIALAAELMPLEPGSTVLQWMPVDLDNMPDDDTRVFFWHSAEPASVRRQKHGYFYQHEGAPYFTDDGDPHDVPHVPLAQVSHWAPWPENEPEAPSV